MNDLEICQSLASIVTEFNRSLTQWHESSGCVASFSWKYSDDDGQAIKELEIQSVDKILFRKPPPGFEALRAAIGADNT